MRDNAAQYNKPITALRDKLTLKSGQTLQLLTPSYAHCQKETRPGVRAEACIESLADDSPVLMERRTASLSLFIPAFIGETCFHPQRSE